MCACVDLKWMCLIPAACPTSLPRTATDCSGLTGLTCDYPDPNPCSFPPPHDH
jgi:hypothetical protein